ncbi:hypothetical protein N0V82_003684 [Gnomoniopsis sp. IMI 355080]|nr:hypothetical protein N0V82_003684 [Gnomoniopsis sp. IMI 355080]
MFISIHNQAVLALIAGLLVEQVSAGQNNSTLPTTTKTHQALAAQSIHFPSISLAVAKHTASSNGTRANTTITHSTTTAPKPTCVLHNQDPDQGINQAYCLCDQTATLSPLSVAKTGHQSDSCAYSTIPATGAQATVTTATSTWTSNCQACTIVGGIADQETCTSVSSCTPTGKPKIIAWVSNSTIAIGDAEDGDDGKTLSKELFEKLSANCQGTSCGQDMATMDNVEYILSGGEEPLVPEMYIQDATGYVPAVFELVYPKIATDNLRRNSSSDIQKMLAVGISSWVAAMQDDGLGLCSNVTYQAEADMTGSGCGEGPIQPSKVRRVIRHRDNKVLFERSDSDLESRCSLRRDGETLDERGCSGTGTGDGNMVCTYSARMCNAPNEISMYLPTSYIPTVILFKVLDHFLIRRCAAVVQTDETNAMVGHLNLGVDIKQTDSSSFSCEDAATIIGALSAITAVLAPEMLESEALEDMDLMAACGAVEDVQSVISAVTSLANQKRTAMPSLPASPTPVL